MNPRLACGLLALLMFPPATLVGKRLQRESVYSADWCSERNGKQEVRTEYGTRADCVFEDAGERYAVEVDFADNWAEGIGQALHYGSATGTLPGLVLVIEQNRDCRYLPRIQDTLKNVRSNDKAIRLWLTGPAAETCKESSP